MVTTIRGVYEGGTVTLDEVPAAPGRTPVLVVFLDEESEEPRAPVPLLGIWKGKVPEDFDLDAALREIRTAWLDELE